MKKYSIENSELSVQITQVGAEICSLKSKNNGKEYMWQGNPEIWGSHAPVLFPIVGGLKNDAFHYKNQAYQLPRHGFIRRNKDLKAFSHSAHQLVLELTSSEKIKKIYPFDFKFQISFELLSNQLKIRHEIFNIGNEAMYFSLGAHPAFNCPLEKDKNYEDYHLEFDQLETLKTWNLDGNGQIKEEGKNILNQSKQLALHSHLFDQDALIFKSLKSRKVSLCEGNHELIRVKFDDFSSLGLWAKPQAPFICIEPWLGYADASESNQQLIEKEGILSLEAEKTFQASYSIEIFNK